MNEENDLRSRLLERLTYALIDSGVAELDDLNRKFKLILGDYKIEPQEKALVVYTEGKNELLMKRFILSKAVQGCTPRTLDYYSKMGKKILQEIGKDADEITQNDIELWVAKRMSSGVSNVTTNNERRVLGSFFAWLTMEEIISKNPMLKTKKLKEVKEKKKEFDDFEIARIKNACVTNREKALVNVLLSTGCRVSELVQIRIDEIHGNKVNILGKGQKRRDIYLNAEAQLSIENYLRERKDNNPYLFCGACQGALQRLTGPEEKRYWYTHPELISDFEMDKSSVEQAMRKIGRRAKVANVHPHRFRRTCATHALRRGMPIEMVSKMLGHASIQTTQIYLDLNEEELEMLHKKFVM